LYMKERIKDLFKTSNGKYVAPQALESQLTIDCYIDQIAIIADQRKFVSALIVPNYKLVEKFAAEHNIKYANREELLQNEEVNELYKQRIDTLQQRFAHYEQIKYFTLLPTPFSMERDELTNTLKLKRVVITKNYKDVIDKMYEC
jgi:long-chain acyl-CoA synthetase